MLERPRAKVTANSHPVCHVPLDSKTELVAACKLRSMRLEPRGILITFCRSPKKAPPRFLRPRAMRTATSFCEVGRYTNYDAASIDIAAELLEKAGLPARIMVDFSHANSRKIHTRQRYVGRDVCDQISHGDKRLMGVMIESNLVEGKQKLTSPDQLTRGQSITDACVGWEVTELILEDLNNAVAVRRKLQ